MSHLFHYKVTREKLPKEIRVLPVCNTRVYTRMNGFRIGTGQMFCSTGRVFCWSFQIHLINRVSAFFAALSDEVKLWFSRGDVDGIPSERCDVSETGERYVEMFPWRRLAHSWWEERELDYIQSSWCTDTHGVCSFNTFPDRTWREHIKINPISPDLFKYKFF